MSNTLESFLASKARSFDPRRQPAHALRGTHHLPPNSPNHPHPNHRPRQQRPHQRPAGVVLPEQFEESEEGGGPDSGAEPEGRDGNANEHGDGDQAHLHHQLGGDAQQKHAGQ